MQDGIFSANEKSKEKGLTPKELIKKHLQDPNHKVTDEELMSLKVGSAAEDQDELKKEALVIEEETKNRSATETLRNPYKVLR